MREVDKKLLKTLTPAQKAEIAGVAICGCVHHAEGGIPCEHDLMIHRGEAPKDRVFL